MSELKSLGRYQIRGVLGQGAMGLVYDGLDPKLNRRVAIKTILTRKLSPDAARMATVRFEREVKAVARLNHPNVVQVYDFATEGDLAYIVMEFVQGKELKDFLDANERFDLKRIFSVMAELLSALDFAHEAGIIHRDVKPANVMVTADGHSKLTDFGVARFTEPDASQIDMTRAGQLIGTPSYMSPEQIQGQTIDRRSDVFSAGILFYQLLTWKKPFSGSQWELAKKIIEDDPCGRPRWSRSRARSTASWRARWRRSPSGATRPRANSPKRCSASPKARRPRSPARSCPPERQAKPSRSSGTASRTAPTPTRSRCT